MAASAVVQDPSSEQPKKKYKKPVPNPDMLCPLEAAGYLNVSRAQFYRLLQKPGFPRPIRLGSRTVRFRRRELDAYLDRTARVPFKERVQR